MFNEAYLIVIWVPGGYGRPYKAPKNATSKQSHKFYYIRKFANSVIASPEEEKQLFDISLDIPFDDRPCLRADVDDLSIDLIRSHLKRIGSSLYKEDSDEKLISLAKDMQLLDGPKENLKPRNVGILMFSRNPEKYFRYARIEVAYMPDITGNNMIEKTFNGPIQQQLVDALHYIKNNYIEEAVLKVPEQAEAIRFYNYPFQAIE